jgi:predicted enzyme related to lactoylglutathione lyase
MATETLTATHTRRDSRVVWFEIPVSDLDRASRFYGQVLGQSLNHCQMSPQSMAVFPYQEPAISGCLLLVPGHQPTATGVTIYLNADPSLDEALRRVNEAGGKVVLEKTALPDGMGVFAHIEDTEGNRVGLHAMK